jgi:hypothetical protein
LRQRLTFRPSRISEGKVPERSNGAVSKFEVPLPKLAV